MTMLNDFVWKNVRGALLLYYKEKRFYCATINPNMKLGHYVSVYITPEHCLEFYEKDLDVAKLKAEIKTKEFYEEIKGSVFDV